MNLSFGSLNHKVAVIFSKPFLLSGQDYNISYEPSTSVKTGQEVFCHGNWMGVAKVLEVLERL